MDPSRSIDAPYSLSSRQVTSQLGSDAERGLSAAEARARLEDFGPNQLPAAPRTSHLRLLAGQFRSVFIIVLLLAAALNLAIWYLDSGGSLPYDTLVIIAIVLANAAIGFIQENTAEKSLEKLRELSNPDAVVIRDGARARITSLGLVPGDIVLIATGDKISADARLLETIGLEIDESTLTGESSTVLKMKGPLEAATPLADRTNMLYAGTTVTRGRGTAVVTATASGTEIGSIATLIQSVPDRETPLKQNLDQLANRLAVIILIACGVVSAAGLIVSGSTDSRNVLNLLLFGVALAVAAIPEGLPAVVTGALALGTKRMTRRRAVIRKLPAVETLGSTTAICSDKTGTLTVGEMTVRELLLPSGKLVIAGVGYRPEGEIEGPEEARSDAVPLVMSAVLCNDATVLEKSRGRWQAVGSPTEAALVTMAAKLGVDPAHLRQQHQRLSEEPFSSERKRMAVAVSSGGGGAVLHCKGAPERIIPDCTGKLVSSRIVPLPEEERRQLLDAALDMAKRSLRPLAIASRQVVRDACEDIKSCEHDLVFHGLVGLHDPPRPEAEAAIRECRQAGIRVIMITGDHLATASSIAEGLGISGRAVSGQELDRASDEELARMVEDVAVFARVSPGHKVRIVAALQAAGHTVAVTGDGVNDAPALKQADIGVAMGLAGTDVAREAADMVLLDDNFATIVAAVEEGRAIFSNIRKFLGFMLSANAGLMLTLFLGVLFAGPLGLLEDSRLVLPLLAVQILWINMITNGPPALALGVDPREADAMTMPPRPRSESVVNREVIRLIVFVGLVTGLGGLLVLNAYFPGGLITFREHLGIEYARTMTFVVLTLYQLFDSLNFRDLKHSVLNRRIAGNRWLLAALALSSSLMVAAVHWPPLQVAFHTAPLLPSDWLIAVAAASVVLWAVELFKLVARRTGQRQ